MSSKGSIATRVKEVFDVLQDFEHEDRLRVLKSTLALFPESRCSEQLHETLGPGGGSDTRDNAEKHGKLGSAKDFFATKEPANKGEELAVAARYLELTQSHEDHARDDIKSVFDDARRNLDSHNYHRDIQNAMRQAGFFNKGSAAKSYKLSYYGQRYVDLLPDRDAVKNLKKPRKKTRSKGKKKGSRK